MLKSAPIRRQELPEDTKIRGGTGAGKEESRRRRSGDQDWRHNPPQDRKGPGLQLNMEGGEECFKKWRRKDVTNKGEPTGFDRGASNVKGRKRGATGRGTRRQKWARGAKLQGPIGTWGVG